MLVDVWVRVDEGGAIQLPAEYRAQLGLRAGDEVMLRLADGEVRILTPRQAIARAQQIVARYVPEGGPRWTTSWRNGETRRRVNDYVLDASALLALLNRESGADRVAEVGADGAVVSADDLAEVTSRLAGTGLPESENREVLTPLQLILVPFDADLAYEVGMFRPRTIRAGLSLGDRVCLALAQRLNLPVLTADRAWRGVDIGV